MKTPRLLLTLTLCASLCACSTTGAKLRTWLDNPANQANIKRAAQVLASAVTLAAPFVESKQAANALWAAGVVARSYGTNGVPTDVIAATTQNLAIARQIVPLIGGNTQDGKGVQIIDAAALLLQQSQITAAPAAPPNG